MLLLIDGERMGLPLRLALIVSGTAHIRGKEASCRHAQPLRPEQHGKAWMIGQVAPNRKVSDNVDPKRTQPFSGADARAVKDGRAVVDAGADDDVVGIRHPPISCRVEIYHALGAFAFQNDAIDMAAGANNEIWPGASGPHISHERAEPDL